jgi:hypothetical protein
MKKKKKDGFEVFSEALLEVLEKINTKLDLIDAKVQLMPLLKERNERLYE